MSVQIDKFQHRNGENLAREFSRSGRFFCISNQWFFKTRESVDYGPFTSRTECKYAYAEFIDVVNSHAELSAQPIEFQDSATDWKMPKINFN